jgi:hypothetical protein
MLNLERFIAHCEAFKTPLHFESTFLPQSLEQETYTSGVLWNSIPPMKVYRGDISFLHYDRGREARCELSLELCLGTLSTIQS